jgi:hypothetical protein
VAALFVRVSFDGPSFGASLLGAVGSCSSDSLVSSA